jgi:TolB-like protein/tetratricopeptide (TPR) repeat protein
MFADMVGYTALMQGDEGDARVQRDRHREILAAAVERHRGEVLQYYGDGTLSLFGSAVEAVECAIAVQLKLGEEPLIPLRIGVHTGDIVRDAEGVYGDGVNVASRIEGLSAPGGVLVTGKVFDEIKNHHSITTVGMGAVNLKNVDHPISVFAIANEGLRVPSEAEMRAKARAKSAAGALADSPVEVRRSFGRAKAVIYGSTVALGLATAAVIGSIWPEGGSELPEDYVAVFPFTNLTGDPELDDLGSAAAYVITDGLSRVEEVRGVATSTVEQAVGTLGGRGSQLEAAEALGVGTAVTGVMTRRGDSLRLSAQITRVGSGEVLPSVEASGAIGEPMVVVDVLEQRVLAALAVSVDAFSGPYIGPASSYAAYKSLQRGFEIAMTGDEMGALPHFLRAYQIDTTFLTPLLWATGTYSRQELWVSADSLVAVLEPRRDELSPVEQLQLEYWTAEVAGDLEASLRAIRGVAQGDPRTGGAWLATTALFAGRPEEAVRAMEYVDLEWETASGWMPVWADLAKANYLTGRYEAALEAAREGRVRFPEDPLLVGYEIWALIALGSLDEIEPLLDRVGEMDPSWGDSPGTIFMETAGELARHGHEEEARAAAERAVAWYVDRDPESHQLERSRALLAAGKPDEALALLGPLIDEDPENVTNHGLRGVALALSGDREGAEAEARWCGELDRPYLRGSNTYWRAAVLAHLGRSDEATRLRRDAFQEGRSYFADPAPADLNFRPLWGYGPFEQIIAPRG